MKRIKMKNQSTKFILSLMMMSVSLSLLGQSYFAGWGLTQNNVYDARSAAMGLSRTALAQNAWSVAGNPALIGASDGLHFAASMLIKSMSETRSIEAIDQFNDVVTKNVYAANSYSHTTMAFAVDYGFKQFSFAYAWVPVHDFSYGFSEEIRNSLSSSYYNRDPLAGYHIFEMNGQVYAHTLGASMNIKSLSIGLSMAKYAAKDMSILKSVSVLSTDAALASATSYSDLTSYELDNATLGTNLGLSYKLTHHTSLHYVFEKIGDMSFLSDGLIPYADSTKHYPEYFKLDSSAVYTISTPATHRMGISFSPGQKEKTIVNFEMELHKAQSITYAETINGLDAFDYALEDYAVFRAGFEHWASPTLPFRLGYSYEESPIDKAFSITRFSVGGSLIVDQFQFDLGANMMSVGYEYTDIFPKVAEANNPGLESVNESSTNLYLTVNYRLP